MDEKLSREPEFLSLEAVLWIHEQEIERYGGSPEILDLAALESAIAQPQAGFGDQYLHSDLFEMAAAYLFHITQNHPFLDGNKRTATAATDAFLEINGSELSPDHDEFVNLVYAVARGEVGKPQVAEFLRANSR